MNFVIKAYKTINQYLDKFLANQMFYRKELLPMFKEANPIHTHTYYSIV